MPIELGQRLPEATFQVVTPHGLERTDTNAIFRGNKVALFGVPGAFTPSCHTKHLPGYLENAAALRAVGVDRIVVTSTNDAFVMQAWSEASGASGIIDFISDACGAFAKAVGLWFDGTDRGMGIRSKRYSMLVDDGIVTRLVIEDSPAAVDASGADALLNDLVYKMKQAA